MKVIWRQKGKDWEIAVGRRYKDESHLQEFLAQNPDLIPFEDVSKEILPPRIMIREVGLPGSGSSDIVGVDEYGGITIIECKLATNPEVKRKVIGQVLEYAAFLWQKPYTALDTIARKRLGKPLVEAMRERLDEESRADWDESGFVESVTQILQSGTFRLVVAVDAVNEDLRRTIEYLAQGPSRVEIYALEIAYFANDGGEILVPHLHGFAPTIVPPRPSQWTRERFFEDARARKLPDQVIETLQALLEFSESEANRVYWGTGRQTGSFTFHHLRDSQIYSLFSVLSDGRLMVNFGSLKDRLTTELTVNYWKALQYIEGFRHMQVRDDFNCWPSVKVTDALPTPEDRQRFQEVVLRFRDRLAEL